MMEDLITETGRVARTLRLDGAKESVDSEMRDFCRISQLNLACAQMAVTVIRQ